MKRTSLPAMSEDDLQRCILDATRVMGLYVHHCRPARMQSGRWATPIQGFKGFPDLVIVGPNGLLIRELKSARGVLSVEQSMWLDRLVSVGVNAGVWTPTDWPANVMADLQGVA